MPDHQYDKSDLVKRFDYILGKTLGEIDSKGVFGGVKDFSLQKGVAGSVIEQSVLGYAPDSKQEADLIILEYGKRIKTELKTTGMVVSEEPKSHYIAKEPMSITAVGVYDIAEQQFSTSHFLEKLEHMLIVYYHYKSNHPVEPYEYRLFPVIGYEFHEFSEDEMLTLQADWEYVHELVKTIVSHYLGPKDAQWKEAVKQEYIETHGELRRVLSYIDLAPKFPPRFRLKKPIVSAIIAKHFGYNLEQLPGKYNTISDVDQKCKELTMIYGNRRVCDIAKELGISVVTASGAAKKSITEELLIAMFGGKSSKLNQIELFERFGLIAKTVAISSRGGRTEDMKLFHIDFNEVTRTEVIDENGVARPIVFEDSDLYSYFADHEFLCVIFEEAVTVIESDIIDITVLHNSLATNRFVGFKRLVFSDEFIDGAVRKLWLDLRDKVLNNKLKDIVQCDGLGQPKVNKSGEISSAPNFMKSSENVVFLRGSGIDSLSVHKTECVNGIRMLPQYVWIKGTAVIEELSLIMQI